MPEYLAAPPSLPPGIEPVYTLAVAIQLIPFGTTAALRMFLLRHRDEFPPRYLRRAHPRRLRMLTQSEVLRIRALRVNANLAPRPRVSRRVSSRERPV